MLAPVKFTAPNAPLPPLNVTAPPVPALTVSGDGPEVLSALANVTAAPAA